MIRFENLCKSFRIGQGRKIIVDNLSLTLPSGKSLALLGRNGAGKSTLLQMVAGTLRPDSGRIVSDGRISWPVGLGGSLHRELTGAQNVRFLARVYGVDTEELSAFVEDFCELGPHFHARCAAIPRVCARVWPLGHRWEFPSIPILWTKSRPWAMPSFAAKAAPSFANACKLPLGCLSRMT